jgi:hypothetical protein
VEKYLTYKLFWELKKIIYEMQCPADIKQSKTVSISILHDIIIENVFMQHILSVHPKIC